MSLLLKMADFVFTAAAVAGSAAGADGGHLPSTLKTPKKSAAGKGRGREPHLRGPLPRVPHTRPHTHTVYTRGELEKWHFP